MEMDTFLFIFFLEMKFDACVTVSRAHAVTAISHADTRDIETHHRSPTLGGGYLPDTNQPPGTAEYPVCLHSDGHGHQNEVCCGSPPWQPGRTRQHPLL